MIASLNSFDDKYALPLLLWNKWLNNREILQTFRGKRQLALCVKLLIDCLFFLASFLPSLPIGHQ